MLPVPVVREVGRDRECVGYRTSRGQADVAVRLDRQRAVDRQGLGVAEASNCRCTVLLKLPSATIVVQAIQRGAGHRAAGQGGGCYRAGAALADQLRPRPARPRRRC